MQARASSVRAAALPLLILPSLLIAPSPVAAQPQAPSRAAAVRRLEPGQYIRLTLETVGRVQGRFGSANDTSFTLTRDAGPSRIRIAEIEQLWVRGRATGMGALLGAGVGAVGGVIFGLLIGSVACEPVDGGDCTAAEVAALTGLLGGAGGAVVGAGIGYVIPVWRLRFP